MANKNKTFSREHYELLKELGIEIIMYDLRSDLHETDIIFGFELTGALTPEVDFDELLDLLRLMKIAKDSKNPAIIDTLDQLRLLIGMTDE